MSENGVKVRCKSCSKMLAMDTSEYLEIKCLRCGTINALFDRMDDQIIITDSNGFILYVNEALVRTTGYSAEEAIGQRPSLWGKQMPKEFYAAMWKKIKDEKVGVKVRLDNVRKNGTKYTADLQISPVLDGKGDIAFFVGVEKLIP